MNTNITRGMQQLIAKYRGLLWLAVLFTLSVSCRNEYEPVFDESANERVKDQIDEYRRALVSAPEGWKAYIYTGSGGGYMFYFEFMNNGTVTMVSDYTDSTSEYVLDGTYALRALQRPSLVFDTYSYIHFLSDPDGTVNNGPLGEGLNSDFEFAIERITDDSVILEGLKENTPMTFVKASASERQAYLNGKIKTSRNNAAVYFAVNQHPYIEIDGKVTPVGISDDTKVFTAFYLDESLSLRKLNIPFTYSENGIQLRHTISIPGLSFGQISYDESQDNYFIEGSSQKLYFKNSSSFIGFPTAIPPLTEVLGSQYNFVVMDPEFKSNNSSSFNDIYDEAAENVETDLASYNLTLGEVILSFESAGEMTINYIVYQEGNPFWCVFNYTYTVSQTGRLNLTYQGLNGNAEIAKNSLLPLINYFESEPLAMSYYADTNAGELLAGVHPQSQQENYFFGLLLNVE